MSSQKEKDKIAKVDNNSTLIGEAEKNVLMKKLEAEGEQQLKELQLKNKLTINSLTGIMDNGFKEFNKKTGRNLTYAEMRAIYG